MDTLNHRPTNSLTPEYLSGLDDIQLSQLLLNRTQILIAAIKSKINDPIYLNDLKTEVEKIQDEIKSRNSKSDVNKIF